MKRKRPVAEAREAESPLIKQRVADPDGVVSRGASNASLTRRDMAKSAGKKTGQRDAADGVEKGGASISGGNGENHVGKNEGDKISGDRIKKQKRGGVRSVRPDGTEIVSGNDMSKGEKRQRENGNTHGADQRAANGGSKRRERQYIDEDKGKRKRKKGTEGDGADTSGKHGEAEEREMGVSSERAKVQVESERNAVTEQDVSNEGKSKRRKEKKKERGVILGGASDVKEISEADAHGSETTGKRKQGAGVCAGVRAADDKGEMLANGGGDKASLRPAPRQSALLDKVRALSGQL